jgi:hypothetical protein
MTESLRLDLGVDPEFCCICTKLPTLRLIMEVVTPDGQKATVSICRDCLAEYAPETLAAIEDEVSS